MGKNKRIWRGRKGEKRLVGRWKGGGKEKGRRRQHG